MLQLHIHVLADCEMLFIPDSVNDFYRPTTQSLSYFDSWMLLIFSFISYFCTQMKSDEPPQSKVSKVELEETIPEKSECVCILHVGGYMNS